MRKSVKTLASIGLATSWVTLGLVGGCESGPRQADRQVAKNIQESQTAQSSDQAMKLLSEAVGNTAASAGTQAYANSLLAEAKHVAAIGLVRDVQAKELEVSGLIWDVSLVGDRLNDSNRLIAAYKLGNPKEALDLLKAQKDDLAKRVEAVNSQAAQAKAQIAKKQTEITELTAKRTEELEQASSLADRAEKAEGEEWVKLFNEGLEHRQAAGRIANSLEHANAAVSDLKQRLASAEGQAEVLKAAIAAADQRGEQMSEGWADAQKSIESEQAQARELEKALAQKCDALNKALADLASKQDAAAGTLKESADLYEKARKAANQLDSELRTLRGASQDRDRNAIWTSIANAHSVDSYRLSETRIQQELGNLYASRAALLQSLKQVSDAVVPVLAAASMQTPDPLSGKIPGGDLKAAQKSASEAYAACEDTFNDLAQSQNLPQAEKTGLQASSMFNYFGRYALSGDAKYLAAAQERLKLVKENGNLSLPLPDALEPKKIVDMPSPEAAPATAPAAEAASATEPAASSADEAAPAAPADAAEGAAAPAAE